MDLSERGKYYIALAVLGLLIFLHFTKILKPVETALSAGLSGVQSYFYENGLKVKNFFQERKDRQFLLDEIDYLKRQLTELRSENQQLEYLRYENRQLKNTLDYAGELDYNPVVAKIVSHRPENSRVFTIDQGANQNIIIGSPVLTTSGRLIGRVISLNPQNSSFLLLTDPLSKLTVFIQKGEELIPGMLEGDLGLSLKIDFLPKDKEISVGDHVITSGWDRGVPQGLYIGQIKRLVSTKNDLFHRATLEPEEINNLSIVNVLVKP